MKRANIQVKWFLIFTKLLYLQGHLSNKQALCLHLYAQAIAIQNKDQLTIEGIKLEMEEWTTFIIKIPTTLLIKLAFKTFKFIPSSHLSPSTSFRTMQSFLREL